MGNRLPQTAGEKGSDIDSNTNQDNGSNGTSHPRSQAAEDKIYFCAGSGKSIGVL
jgi:hypothetical protein